MKGAQGHARSLIQWVVKQNWNKYQNYNYKNY